MCFNPIESLEEDVDVLLVGFLRAGETSLVDAVVDVVVHPLVELIDVFLQRVRQESTSWMALLLKLLWQNIVKLSVEHAYDLRAFVVDNRLVLLVPQSGHQDSTFIPRFCFLVELAMACESVQGVFLHGSIASTVTPALGKHFVVHYHKLDNVFESFEESHNGCAVCPRATPIDVENLSICQICARQVIPYALCYKAGNVFYPLYRYNDLCWERT